LVVIDYSLKRIRVKVSPRSLRIEQGSAARFICSDNSETTSTLTWTYDGNKLPKEAIVRNGILTIANVQRKHSGLYRCSGSNQYSSDVVTAQLSVGVIVKPQASISPSYQAVDIGATVKFRCSATGYPVPKITWKRGSSKSLQNRASSNNAYLTIRDIETEDEGEYYCFVSNRGGTVSRRVMLYVREADSVPNVSLDETEKRTRIGTTAVFTCTISGYNTKLSWTRQNGILPYRSNVQNGILTIPDVRFSDQDLYKCTGENVYGKKSATVKLLVIRGR